MTPQAAAKPAFRRQVSQLLLLRVILVLRLLVLVVLPIQEALGKGLAGHEDLWAALAVAAAYTMVVAILSKRVIVLHLRTWAFTFIDMGVMFALYFATGSGTNWPLFLLASTTLLVLGLRGQLGSTVALAAVWNVLMSLAWVFKGSTFGEAFGISSFDDLFNLSLAGGIWAYSIGLIAKLNRAEDDLDSSREALVEANTELAEREKEILGLIDVGNAISARVDLDGILRVIREVLEGMGLGGSRVWLLRSGRLTTAQDGAALGSVAYSGEGPLARAVRERRVVTVRAGEGGRGPDDLPGVDPGRTAIVVPVAAEGEAFGAIVAESPSGEPFGARETESLELFAELTALALRHVRFYELAWDQAVAEERNRMALELGETVVRSLERATAIAESLEERASTPEAAARMRLIADTLRGGMKDLRVAVLNWDSLDWSGGVTQTAKRYTDRFSELSGIVVAWDVQGVEHLLSAGQAKDLLRILQETLANAWRHGGATRIEVSVSFGSGGVELSVQDDGRGFDVRVGEQAAGIGLRSIRDRGERNNGKTSVTSSPGEGTLVSVWMPCAGGAT